MHSEGKSGRFGCVMLNRWSGSCVCDYGSWFKIGFARLATWARRVRLLSAKIQGFSVLDHPAPQHRAAQSAFKAAAMRCDAEWE